MLSVSGKYENEIIHEKLKFAILSSSKPIEMTLLMCFPIKQIFCLITYSVYRLNGLYGSYTENIEKWSYR